MAINERIEAIEKELWLMDFIDKWRPVDHERANRLKKELRELKNNA